MLLVFSCGQIPTWFAQQESVASREGGGWEGSGVTIPPPKYRGNPDSRRAIVARAEPQPPLPSAAMPPRHSMRALGVASRPTG